MEKILDFKTLPDEIKIDIVITLFNYNECHIEHAHGKMSVATSYCLKSSYADDEWISAPFTKKELGIKVEGWRLWDDAWIGLERQKDKKWSDIDIESKTKLSDDFNKKMVELARVEIKRIEGAE